MASSQYVCSNCSSTFPKWMGKCTKCGEYNTIDEGVSASSGSAGLKGSKSATPMRPAQRAGDIKASPKDRLASGLTEFDRILNGGLTIGQVTLIAGEPGAGKSTLLIDLMHRFGEKGHTCLYVSGEESSEQIGLRAQRVGAVSTNLFVADETNLENVLGHIDQVSPDVVVIDSVQAVASPNIDSRAGGIAQVQEVAGTLTRLAKERGIRMILVGQITKSLEISGPMTLMHLVDSVLLLEGDKTSSLRLLRVMKNRFGPADEVACFEQEDDGMRQVVDPSGMFSTHRTEPQEGVCPTIVMEGKRALIAELQALIASTNSPNPRRGQSGVDSARTAMLIAVTEKHGKVRLYDKDSFVATVGGMKVSEPAADLAICLAIASAASGDPLPLDVCAIGEVALSGDVRRVPQMRQRLAEASRMGFRTVLVPTGTPKVDGVVTVPIGHVSEAFRALNRKK